MFDIYSDWHTGPFCVKVPITTTQPPHRFRPGISWLSVLSLIHWAMMALLHHVLEYKHYFSFPFIRQLKSVAHLPWRAFMYKVIYCFLPNESQITSEDKFKNKTNMSKLSPKCSKFYLSSVESQKGTINIQRCFVEDQKGAIAVQSL